MICTTYFTTNIFPVQFALLLMHGKVQAMPQPTESTGWTQTLKRMHTRLVCYQRMGQEVHTQDLRTTPTGYGQVELADSASYSAVTTATPLAPPLTSQRGRSPQDWSGCPSQGTVRVFGRTGRPLT